MPAFEEEGCARAGLVAVVLADLAFLAHGIVGLAYPESSIRCTLWMA